MPYNSVIFSRAAFSITEGTWVAPPKITELYGNINRFLNYKIVTAVFALLALGRFVYLNRKGEMSTTAFAEHLFEAGNRIIIFAFALPYLLMFALSYKAPMFIDRYILFTSIPLYIIFAIVLIRLFAGKMLYVATGIMIVAQLIYYNPKPDNNRRIKDVAEYVKSIRMIVDDANQRQKADHKQNEDSINIGQVSAPFSHRRRDGDEVRFVFIAPTYANLGFAYHYNQAIFKDYKNFTNRLTADEIYSVSNVEDLQKTISLNGEDTNHGQNNTDLMQKISKNNGQVTAKFRHSPLGGAGGLFIFIEAGSEFVDPNKTMLNYLKNHYKLKSTKAFFEIYTVYTFVQ